MPIAEAFALKAGETALTAALRAATAYLAQARAAGQRRVSVCLQYLSAASVAVRGLEQEYQSILAEADNCDFTSPSDRQAFRRRIATYLYVDRLRPVLWESIAGLEFSRKALEADAGRFMGVPVGPLQFRQEQRQDALEALDEMLEGLRHYVTLLEAVSSLGTAPGGSAPGMAGNYLVQLLQEVPRPYEDPPGAAAREAILTTVGQALAQ